MASKKESVKTLKKQMFFINFIVYLMMLKVKLLPWDHLQEKIVRQYIKKNYSHKFMYLCCPHWLHPFSHYEKKKDNIRMHSSHIAKKHKVWQYHNLLVPQGLRYIAHIPPLHNYAIFLNIKRQAFNTLKSQVNKPETLDLFEHSYRNTIWILFLLISNFFSIKPFVSAKDYY